MGQIFLPPLGIGDKPLDIWNLVDMTNTAVNLTGVLGTNINLILRDFRTGMKKAGKGTFTILSALEGQISYFWDASDTAIVGNFRLSFQVTFPLSGQILTFGLVDQVIQPVQAQ